MAENRFRVERREHDIHEMNYGEKSVTWPSGSKLEHLSIPIALLQSTGLQFRRNLMGVVAV